MFPIGLVSVNSVTSYARCEYIPNDDGVEPPGQRVGVVLVARTERVQQLARGRRQPRAAAPRPVAHRTPRPLVQRDVPRAARLVLPQHFHGIPRIAEATTANSRFNLQRV